MHKNENPFKYFNYVPIGHKIFDKQKENSFQKDFWKQGPILALQKFITTIWLKFFWKKFTFNFMISLFNPCLIIINNLELN